MTVRWPARLAALAIVVAAITPLLAQAPPRGAKTHDGVLEFVPNPDEGTITVYDRLNGETLSRNLICPGPQDGALTRDEVFYVVACQGTREVAFLNTAAFDVDARVQLREPPSSVSVTADGRYAEARNASGETIGIIDLSSRRLVDRKSAPPPPEAEPELNELIFLGTIHDGHRTSERYSLEILRRLVLVIQPDYWLTEIAPNRLGHATDEFMRRGRVAEPRVSRFPEYVDVLFPLSRWLRYQVIGTAGWNHPMDRYRRERLDAIAHDPARAADWARYQEAIRRSEAAIAAGGAPDDPRWIHTDAYDQAQRIRLDVYNELFDKELGTGGWDTINEAHYANITQALDAHRGEGARFLVTYGAAHKSWLLPRLRERGDIRILEVTPFLDAARVPK
ncbi:MAG: YncE family protein [Vicinamibacterales bacterium]